MLAPLHGTGGGSVSTDPGRGARVTVDDVAVSTARLSGGALGSFEATRCATGRENALTLEVSGSTGAIASDLEDVEVLSVHVGQDRPHRADAGVALHVLDVMESVQAAADSGTAVVVTFTCERPGALAEPTDLAGSPAGAQ